MRVLLTALFGLILWTTAAQACGPDTDCVVDDRIYRIRMPEGYDGKTPIGAIIHAHGYRGTAKGVMKNKGMARMASQLGVALIAPKSKGDDWLLPGAPRKTHVDGSAEFEYFDALIADVTQRFPIDTKRLMVSGFSAGGMMTWNLACHRGEMFAAFAPIAGTFWEPIPKSCPSGPVHLIHTHGMTDEIVPLDGRIIADTKQGEVLAAMEMIAPNGELGTESNSSEDDLDCERATGADGHILELCFHDGGHSIKSKWLASPDRC